VGIEVDDVAPDPLADEKARMKEALLLAAKIYHYVLKSLPQGESARRYLKQRGLTDETIDFFQIGFAPDSWDFIYRFLEKRGFEPAILERAGLLTARDQNNVPRYYDRFRGRLMIPIRDEKGNIIAFGGRVLGEGQPKYLNSPETPLIFKSRTLFHLNHARKIIRKKQRVILMEGYMDVITAHQYGVEDVVATLGTSLNEGHAKLLKRHVQEVIICYDGDSAGQSAAAKGAEILKEAGLQVKIATIPNRWDPDEYLRKRGKERFVDDVIHLAQPYTAFMLKHLRKSLYLQDETDRLKYLDQAVQVIAGLPHPIERDHYLRELAEEFNLSLDVLKQELRKKRTAQQEKRRHQRDKVNAQWNNTINNGISIVSKPDLLPAHVNAERTLLAWMMQNAEIAGIVQAKIGNAFQDEIHSALAAYLYSYYQRRNEMDTPEFLSHLQDIQLIERATQLMMLTVPQNPGMDAVESHIREVKKYPLKIEIERKNALREMAEKQGHALEAAKIAQEILELQKELRY
jgi:DNA primase